jgi:hypothetical protein
VTESKKGNSSIHDHLPSGHILQDQLPEDCKNISHNVITFAKYLYVLFVFYRRSEIFPSWISLPIIENKPMAGSTIETKVSSSGWPRPSPGHPSMRPSDIPPHCHPGVSDLLFTTRLSFPMTLNCILHVHPFIDAHG